MEGWVCGVAGVLAATSGECVVPVVGRRPQTLDRQVAGDQLAAGAFTRLVRVEAAVEVIAAGKQWPQPRGIRSHSGGRDTDAPPQ